MREECLSSSSSSSEDEDEEKDSGKEACSHSDHFRRSEEEDIVPRGLWSGGKVIIPESRLIFKFLICYCNDGDLLCAFLALMAAAPFKHTSLSLFNCPRGN